MAQKHVIIATGPVGGDLFYKGVRLDRNGNEERLWVGGLRADEAREMTYEAAQALVREIEPTLPTRRLIIAAA